MIEGHPTSELEQALDGSLGESVWLGGVRMVVSPAAGRLRHLPPVHLHEGVEWVTAGQPFAVVEKAGKVTEIRSTVEGKVTGFMVRDGEPVAVGQPVVWLEIGKRPEVGPTQPEKR
jgi:biotin carboxyl carrier protein